MALSHRRQTVSFVFSCILVVANSNMCFFHQTDDKRNALLFVHFSPSQISCYLIANVGERFSKSGHSEKFRTVFNLIPPRMVEVLFSPFAVNSDCLEMTVWIIGYANIFPSRRNNKFFNTSQRGFILYVFSVMVIGKSSSSSFAFDCQLFILIIHKLSYGSCFFIIINNFFNLFWREFHMDDNVSSKGILFKITEIIIFFNLTKSFVD